MSIDSAVCQRVNTNPGACSGIANKLSINSQLKAAGLILSLPVQMVLINILYEYFDTSYLCQRVTLRMPVTLKKMFLVQDRQRGKKEIGQSEPTHSETNARSVYVELFSQRISEMWLSSFQAL